MTRMLKFKFSETRSKRKKFNNIFQRNARRVYGMAWKLSGFNRSDADDLFQETFLRAYQAFDGYQDESKEAAWLIKICININREKWRRRKFYDTRVEPLYRDFILNPAVESPEKTAEVREIQKFTASLLEEMPSSLKEVIILRHLECCSTKQTAELLAIPEGTVRSRLNRARKILMEKYREKYGE